MNINVSILSGFIIGLAIFMAIVSYYLGRRKTETPILVAAIGCFTAFIPPVALVYLIILVFKRDISQQQIAG